MPVAIWSRSRQDGALIGSIDLAINKAYTARIFDISTATLATLAQPSGPLYGIQHSNRGSVVIFGGGIPVWRDGVIIGAIGTSAGRWNRTLRLQRRRSSHCCMIALKP
jgi:uncharacterized protein GlcG (DUF336 family)